MTMVYMERQCFRDKLSILFIVGTLRAHFLASLVFPKNHITSIWLECRQKSLIHSASSPEFYKTSHVTLLLPHHVSLPSSSGQK